MTIYKIYYTDSKALFDSEIKRMSIVNAPNKRAAMADFFKFASPAHCKVYRVVRVKEANL